MESQIIGVYDSEQEVVQEIKKYESDGIDRNKFSIMAKDDTSTDYLTENMDVDEKHPANHQAFGILGGIFAGIGGGVVVPGMTQPGTGPIVAAGPIASTITSKNNEDIRKMFSSMGVNKADYDNYIRELEAGKIILFLD